MFHLPANNSKSNDRQRHPEAVIQSSNVFFAPGTSPIHTSRNAARKRMGIKSNNIITSPMSFTRPHFFSPFLLFCWFTQSQRICSMKAFNETPNAADSWPSVLKSAEGILRVYLSLVSIFILLTSPPCKYILAHHLFDVNSLIDFF